MAQPVQNTFRQTFNISKELLRWYPGHMEKGMLQMQSKLKSVDCVIEVHDARVAISGRNPNFVKKLLGVKPHILVLNKMDLLDEQDLKLIKSKMESDGVENVVFTNCRKYYNCNGVKKLVPMAIDMIQKSPRFNRSEERDLTMMIIGIPNVGKSTLINSLRKRNLSRGNATPVGPLPGVTRSVMTRIRVNVNPVMYLIDTPGILPPNIQDNIIGLKLALCDCLRNSILGEYVLADFLLYWLNKSDNFTYVADLNLNGPSDNIFHVLLKVAHDYNLFKKKTDVKTGSLVDMPDLDMAAKILIDKFRTGKLGSINLDKELMCENAKS